MNNYYIINTYSVDSRFISSSDVFYSKSEAQEFKEYLDSSNAFINRVVYCIIMPDKEDVKIKQKSKMFKIFNHGKGYFMKCPRQNVYYGMSKIEDGKWNSELGGWIFPSTCDLEKLSKLGEFTNTKYSGKKRYNLRQRSHE